MAFPEYTRLPFSAYPQNPAQDAAGAGYASYGSQLNAQNAYNANQQRLAAEQAWNAQQQAAAPNTYANRSELERELAYNENEIRYLQNQLETMRAEWMDQDSFDRKLAANRAAIGDFGNARAHQNDIIARQNDRNRLADTAMQWRWQAKQNEIARQADQQKQVKKTIKDIIAQIDDIDVMLPHEEKVAAKESLESKKQRLVRELAEYGVDYSGYKPPFIKADIDQELLRATNEKGNIIDANVRSEIAAKYRRLDDEESAKRVEAMKTPGEVADAKARRATRKANADALVKQFTGMDKARIATFRNRWNAGTDADIKAIKEFYNFDPKTGLFTAKR